jgi:uncharacterized coiled-coil protein SlyX
MGMKYFSSISMVALSLLVVVGCKSKSPLDSQVQEHSENIRVLNQKVLEQEKFIEEAKRVLSEHRSHILSLQEELGKLSSAKKKAPQPTKPQMKIRKKTR